VVKVPSIAIQLWMQKGASWPGKRSSKGSAGSGGKTVADWKMP